MNRALACLMVLGLAELVTASENHVVPTPPPAGENTYSEGRGLRLSATVLAEMEIRIESVEERSVTVTESETGRVLAGGSRVAVLVMTPEARASSWRAGTAAVVSGLAGRVRSNRNGEVIVDVEGGGSRLTPGSFVPVHSAARSLRGVLLPEASVVDRGSGVFAYVRNEDYLKRVPVTVGRRAGGWVEITDGLLPGDEVATGDVAALWIAELRAVTGGGRCCPL